MAEFVGNNAVLETTRVSPFFTNYRFNLRIGVELAKPCPPKLSNIQKREFFKASEIAARFKAVINQVRALSRQS